MNKTINILVVIVLSLVGTVFGQRVSVTEPHSGVTWYRGEPQNIHWTIDPAPPPGTTVDIYLLQGGRWVRDIARGYGTGATGDFSWPIANDTPLGASQVQVIILSSGVSGNSDTFTIAQRSMPNIGLNPRSGTDLGPRPRLIPQIRVISPNGGESFTVGSHVTVHWEGVLLPPGQLSISIQKYEWREGTGWVPAGGYTLAYVDSTVTSILVIMKEFYRGRCKILVQDRATGNIRDWSDDFFIVN